MKIRVRNVLYIISLFILGLLLVLLNTGCGDPEILSAKKAKDLAVDGKNTEWKGGTEISSADAFLNVCNDGSALYISLTSKNNALMQRIAATGLTVWLDPQTKNGKIIGIHYPLGMMSMAMPMPDMEGGPPPQREEGMDPMQERFTNFEVLNEDKSVLEKKKLSDVKDMQLVLGQDTSEFVYEMKIPFAKLGKANGPYTIMPDSTGNMRLGLETGELDFPMGPPPGGMPPPMEGGGGGMPPPDGGGGPPPDGMPPGMRPGRMTKMVYLDSWFKVKLQPLQEQKEPGK